MLQRLSPKLYFDFKDIKNTILLVGTGRSGTTWVEDIINCNNDYRVLFEPFHSLYVPELSHWKHRQYISPRNVEPTWFADAYKILSGEVRNSWFDRYNTKFIAKRRIVKDIRIHLSLRWIKNKFPYIPIVYLLRHPCAVAKSKEALQWDTDLEIYLEQKELMETYLNPFEKIIRNAKTNFEKHIVSWCIENFMVLSQFESHELYICFYEDLCLEPNIQGPKLLRNLNISSDKFNNVVNKPSALSGSHSAILQKNTSLVGGWKNKISEDELRYFQDALGSFGLNCLYDETSTPKLNADDVLDTVGAV